MVTNPNPKGPKPLVNRGRLKKLLFLAAADVGVREGSISQISQCVYDEVEREIGHTLRRVLANYKTKAKPGTKRLRHSGFRY